MTTRILTWGLGISLALALLLGVGYCREREARQRDVYDAKADSLSRNTRDATAALTVADTVYVRSDRRYTEVRRQVDTVTLSPETRAVVRACDALQTTCAARARASDSLIRNLRRELEHALDPPPGPRLSWRVRGGRDLLASGWEAAAGPRFRLIGPVEAYAEIGASPFMDSTGVRRGEARLVVGAEITFGRRQ